MSNNKLNKFFNERKAKPECPYTYVCGGCDLQELSYKDQLEYKQIKTEQFLSKFGKVKPIIGMDNPIYYRNKVHATFSYDRGKVISGLYEKNSHNVININICMIQNDKANEIINTITDMVNKSRIEIFDEDKGTGLLRHVLIRTAHKTGEILVVLVVASDYFPSRNNFAKALMRKHPKITTIVQNINNRKTSMILGYDERVIKGKGFIIDELCGLTFRISPQSFYQVNSLQAEKLYNNAMEFAKLTGEEVVLDAYSGIGTIGLIASRNSKKVVGVESNSQAIYDSIKNSKANKIINAKFYKDDASEFLLKAASHGEKFDVVFLDPPREGSDQSFLSSLIKTNPKRVVYISCNPETQARDLEYLTSFNYKVEKIQPVDMFPYTSHVETVCLLLNNSK
jgi:23S rRNA (uracil1939-C5)-methyltransferase